MRFHHATQNGVQFETYELLFLEFKFNIFRSWLNVGTWNHRRRNYVWGEVAVHSAYHIVTGFQCTFVHRVKKYKPANILFPSSPARCQY